MSLGQITVAPVLPMGLIFFLCFLGVASAIAQYVVLRRRLGKSRALGLSMLRLGAILFLISFALNPSLVSRKEHRVRPSVTLLVDTSQSMGQGGRSGKASRLEEARAILTEGPEPLLKALNERFEVRTYGLGDSLKPFDPGQWNSLKPNGTKGDLTKALKELSPENTMVILLSDGNLTWDESPPAGPPVFAVPLGNPEVYKDILIKRVKAPSVAFRGREVVIDVTIKSEGYSGLTVPVLLKDGGKLVTAKNIRIPANAGEITASLSFVPEEVGERNFSISIPQQFGESLLSNNSVNLSLNVVRDKIRVLMVSGSPSMNYRFMRMALKSDPSVDLLSFIILRTPSDIMNVPQQEQSLIPFPVETIFSKEIVNFDLLIFDNFNYSLYLSPHHLESIREFVRRGGGFAMIGGPHFLDEGRYAGTPIGEIMPVRFKGNKDYDRDLAVKVKLSRAGMNHPITRWSSEKKADRAESSSFWEEVPPLDGINFLEAKSSASVLLESTDGVPWPILTVSGYGKGRVLALATDYSWKWYTGMAAQGKGNWPYLRLIDRMVRWLTKDPSLDPVQITLPENPGTPGKEIEARVRLREEDLSSNLRSMISFSVFNAEGLKVESKLRPTGHPGEYLGSFLPEKEGVYRIRIETPDGTKEESLVVPGVLESLDAAPDHEQLRRISASTGGKVLPASGLMKEVETVAGKKEDRFIEENRTPVWATPYVMAIVLGFLVIEWYYRRRWGLV